ncbi:MAG: host-nuclease inhibitor Gam family protein [Candidatus Accumulibacter sp.]|nr:host-nuclease inhibitor Gam family protein [Accumulibacter sp.]
MKSRSNKLKQSAAVSQVPQTLEQADEAIAAIGGLQRHLARLTADMNDQLTTVKQAYEKRAEPLLKMLGELQEGTKIWCEANRAMLTRDGKTKTVPFPSGEVAWRMRPPSVSVRGTESALKRLRQIDAKRFIRTKEEINRQAILDHPEILTRVPELSITQGEDFVITPFDVPLDGDQTL